MLRDIAAVLDTRASQRALCDAVRAGAKVRAEGLSGSHAAAVLHAVWRTVGRPLAVVVPSAVDIEVLRSDISAFHEAAAGAGRIAVFPGRGVNPYGSVPPHDDILRERLQTLEDCLSGRVAVVLAPARAWMECLQSPIGFRAGSTAVRAGDQIAPAEVARRLVEAGYRRVSMVESAGEFAVRGGIVDAFSPTRDHPVRMEFFGDDVESLREFNPRDQRSMRDVKRFDLPPATALGSADTAAELNGADTESATLSSKLADYVQSPLWVEYDPPILQSDAQAWVDYLEEHYHQAIAAGTNPRVPGTLMHALDGALARATQAEEASTIEAAGTVEAPRPEQGRLEIATLAGTGRDTGDGFKVVRLDAQAAPGYRGRLADLSKAVRRQLDDGRRVLMLLSTAGKAQRTAEILEGYGVRVALRLDDNHCNESDTARTLGGSSDAGIRANAGEIPAHPDVDSEAAVASFDIDPSFRLSEGTPQETTCWVSSGALSAGFRVPDVGLWVSTDTELFGRVRPPIRRRRSAGRAFEGDFRDLQPGDTIIHEDHGVGRFVSVRSIDVGGDGGLAAAECMEVEYLGGGRLFVPLDQLYLVQKFRAGDSVAPRLDKLGGTGWHKAKGRVKRELREMAADLLELYAARKASYGHPFGGDTPWQLELEQSFEFDETPDQLSAIDEIKRDMEKPEVMDRLLCGDVGYGKTEVAMRASFKAVMDGKQVAVLAPTTVLAHQHWRTFKDRFAAFPVAVRLISRFSSSTEQREITRDVRDAKVDVLIGTHRLLSKDIEFPDLGLLIVDEEQRFGVGQKEKLKRFKREVDVLSMTATPIPRTLQMSLLGVRDLSVIETPPRDRYAIATHIVPYDAETIADAIRAELARGGQVFFVHNRVQSIYSVARNLEKIVPEASYRVAHGQLPQAELERVMLDFVDGAADVLVTTSIIENGLDIPLANTIVVNRADRFGLAQLYQLRGRVGRSNRRAYAYLIVPPVDTLSEVAKKRLRAIQEFSDLGSGFRLAAMDLEIRGAGSLLGERQHGHIAAVGFELYARLLEEAVGELRGQPAAADLRAQLNLGIDLRLPEAYIEDPLQRLTVSKRLTSARTTAQLEALQKEVRDRYGPLPSVVETLFRYAALRLAAEDLGIRNLDRHKSGLALRFGNDSKLDLDRLVELVRQREAWQLLPPDRLLVQTTKHSAEVLLEAAWEAVEALT